MDNYFEKFIAGLPYNIKNDRYAILIDTHLDTPGTDTMNKFLINEQKFLPENIIKLNYTEATIENFKKAVLRLSGEVDENDIVLVTFESHGGEGSIAFNDGFGDNTGKAIMSYKEIDTYLDTIKPKAMVVTVSACGQETALEPLKEGPSPRVVMTMTSDWFFATSKNYKNQCIAYLRKQFDPMETKDYDMNGDGYVSIKESYEAQMKSMQRYLSEHPEQAVSYGIIIYLHNISEKLYLGDFSIFTE